MNKSDLMNTLAQDQNLPLKTAESIIANILDAMTETMVNGGNVEICGFGSFIVRDDVFI
jgi:integration host factor subunit beta